jgi:pantetheine-phosphate adenylyltransferase
MRAVIAGSFDPLTNGHIDIIQRAGVMFDEVVVAIGHNENKRTRFTLEQRVELARQCTLQFDNVSVDSFTGLLVHYCEATGAGVIVRGLRSTGDFGFEQQIGLANKDMVPSVETVFLLSDPSNSFISSSLVKEIANHGGDVSGYVPSPVLAALQA